MRNGRFWLAVCLSLSAISCAHAFGPKRPERPAREICILGVSGCVCFDPRLSKDRQNYIRPYDRPWGDGGCLDFIATNVVDHDAGEEWIARNCLGPKPVK